MTPTAMTPTAIDLCLFVGGFFGPYLRALLGKGPRFSWMIFGQALLTGSGMVSLVGLQLLPDWFKLSIIALTPFRAVAITTFISTIAGAGIIYAITAAVKKFFPEPPESEP